MYGCSSKIQLPDLESIDCIHVSLNDPANPGYWDVEGYIDERHWPTLLQHFSTKPYKDEVLRWGAIAVVTLKTKDGSEINISVFDTKSFPGCYEMGRYRYYELEDEKQFIADARKCLEKN